MGIYLCMFCGVTCHSDREITSCAICGMTSASGWLQEEASASTGKILSRQTAFDLATARAALQACMQACNVSGDECQQHAQHGMTHCQTCMTACRRCEEACHTLLALLPG